MLSIEIRTVDELHAIVAELDTIHYLQKLLQTEAIEQSACAREFDDRISYAQDLLLGWQTASLDKLRNLVHKDDFTRRIVEVPLHNGT